MNLLWAIMLACIVLALHEPLKISYYEVIGVSPTCTKGELKKAYRKLALKYHPDRISDPALKVEAENKFVVIAKGYDVLSNEELRVRYNELVKDGIFEYDEEAWDERVARKRGWRSQREEDAADGYALLVSALVLLLAIGWALYNVLQKSARNKLQAQKAQKRKLATISKEKEKQEKVLKRSGKFGEEGKSDGKNSRRQQVQLQQQESNYKKNLKVYHKEIRQMFRSLVQDHTIWFAPKIQNDEISILCEALTTEELVMYTRQLCAALSTTPPQAPAPPSGVVANAPSVKAKDIIKELAARVAAVKAKEQ